MVLGSVTTTTTPGFLGRFAGPSVLLDEVSPYLARLRWGPFSDFPKHQRRTNRWGLSHYLPCCPPQWSCFQTQLRHSAWTRARVPSSVTLEDFTLMIKLNSTIIRSSDS